MILGKAEITSQLTLDISVDGRFHRRSCLLTCRNEGFEMYSYRLGQAVLYTLFHPDLEFSH